MLSFCFLSLDTDASMYTKKLVKDPFLYEQPTDRKRMSRLFQDE